MTGVLKMDFGITGSGSYGMDYSRWAGQRAWGTEDSAYGGRQPLYGPEQEEEYGVQLPGTEDEEDAADKAVKGGHRSTPAECETCKNRKYQDGSDEMVSFKAAGHIDPDSAAAVVMSHEQEHVSNAYQKADKGNGEVVRASVRLKTDVCPECGRTYISGGETTTQIRYYNEGNPYQKDMKESDGHNKYRGANVDIAA